MELIITNLGGRMSISVTASFPDTKQVRVMVTPYKRIQYRLQVILRTSMDLTRSLHADT
jgi:hypothetical protein